MPVVLVSLEENKWCPNRFSVGVYAGREEVVEEGDNDTRMSLQITVWVLKCPILVTC